MIPWSCLSVITTGTSISRQIGGSLSIRSMRSVAIVSVWGLSSALMPPVWQAVAAVPRQQIGQPIDRMPLGHAIDHVGEVGLGIEAAQLGAFQHGVEDRGALAARLGVQEQEVLAGDGDGAQRALGDIVVD